MKKRSLFLSNKNSLRLSKSLNRNLLSLNLSSCPQLRLSINLSLKLGSKDLEGDTITITLRQVIQR